MNGRSTVSDPKPLVTYTLTGVRKAVGRGVTGPEVGDVAAIIKQDGQESRAQIYSEYVAGRLAVMVGVTVAAGVLVVHAAGVRYASLKVAEVGFALADIEQEHVDEVVARYPVEAANLAVFDVWIGNGDRAGNLRANLQESTNNLIIGLDHGGSLLSAGESIDAALERMRRTDFPRGHLFAERLDRRLADAMVERIARLSDEAIHDACVLGETLGSVILPDQADLADALVWRRNNLQGIVDRTLFPTGQAVLQRPS